jgi:hypothetical protein
MTRLLTLLGAGALAGRAESNAPLDPAALPDTSDLLHGFAQKLDALDALDTGAPAAGTRQAAAAPVFRLVEDALQALRKRPGAPLATAQILGLETVVRADGTRPSLILRNGAVDPDHPLAAGWRDTLASTRAEVGKIALATARVQARGGSRTNYFGSGFLFDAGKGLLVTNQHVAGAALRKAIAPSRRRLPGGQVDTYRLYGDLIECEFDGELGSATSTRCAVREIALPASACGPGQQTPDIAVLRLEPLDGASLPEALVIAPRPEFEECGALTSICTVGFPATPRHRTGIVGGIDWAYVDKTLFDEQYGVKRLAPGEVHRKIAPGEFGRYFTFGHDTTTLGGSSGSGVFAWLDGAQAFGLHFFGVSADTNLAHGFGAAENRPLLEELGILAPQ